MYESGRKTDTVLIKVCTNEDKDDPRIYNFAIFNNVEKIAQNKLNLYRKLREVIVKLFHI